MALRTATARAARASCSAPRTPVLRVSLELSRRCRRQKRLRMSWTSVRSRPAPTGRGGGGGRGGRAARGSLRAVVGLGVRTVHLAAFALKSRRRPVLCSGADRRPRTGAKQRVSSCRNSRFDWPTEPHPSVCAAPCCRSGRGRRASHSRPLALRRNPLPLPHNARRTQASHSKLAESTAAMEVQIETQQQQLATSDAAAAALQGELAAMREKESARQLAHEKTLGDLEQALAAQRASAASAASDGAALRGELERENTTLREKLGVNEAAMQVAFRVHAHVGRGPRSKLDLGMRVQCRPSSSSCGSKAGKRHGRLSTCRR